MTQTEATLSQLPNVFFFISALLVTFYTLLSYYWPLLFICLLLVPAEIAQTLILSQAVDVILVLCLLACWVSACFVFYEQWSSFHLQLPNKYTHYKNLPKGLENIKVGYVPLVLEANIFALEATIQFNSIQFL